MIKLDRELEDLDAMIVHTLHDAIIVEAEEGIVNEVKATLEDCMIEAFEKLGLEVPFKVEIGIQETWG